jgi:hypothetical protein
MLFSSEKRLVVVLLGGWMCCWLSCAPAPVARGWWTGPMGGLSFLRRVDERHGVVRQIWSGWAGSIKRGDRADAGGQTTNGPHPAGSGGQPQNGPHPAEGWWSCRGHRLQAADLAIAQRVVDQADQVTRRRGDADVAAAALPDLVASSTGAAVFACALRGLDRGPTDQHAALFGDPAAVHRGVGLMVFRGQSGPAGQLGGARENG